MSTRHTGSNTARTSSKPLRRTVLEVPGNVQRMLDKATGLSVDVLVFDLEDSVQDTIQHKAEARSLISEVLERADIAAREIGVRINAPDTKHYADDIAWLNDKKLDLVFLPKVSSESVYAEVEAEIDRTGIDATTGIALIVEHPGALEDLGDIARKANRLSMLVAGGYDYTLECGSNALNAMAGLGGLLSDGHLTYMRQRVVAVARARGLTPIDGILVAKPKDNERVRAAADRSRQNGFEGCMVFYPPMLEAVDAAFTPTNQEEAWARRVIAAHADAVEAGRGAFVLDGVAMLAHHVTVAKQILGED